MTTSNTVTARKRMRVTKSEQLKRERKAKKNERLGEKLWVEITSQPKKTGKAWVGRASFIRKKDKDKKRHSVPITVGGPAKLKIKSKKLYVRPKDGDEYIWGGDKTPETKEQAKKNEGKLEDDLGPPLVDTDGDGVQDMARVGVPAKVVPTPPNIPRLPNLTEAEQAIEARAIEVFENDPDGVTDQYMKMVGDSNKFVTDDAKLLFPDYTPKGKSPEEIAANRARHNVLLHQVANAIAKRAFIKKLDELAELPDGDPRKSVLVTSGGVGSGKGYSIKNGPDEVQKKIDGIGAIWDAAGEQNATENPWILEEARKRGIKSTFLFVDSDPSKTWDGPWGVVKRAANPPPEGEGRMVDARLFGDSYALGAQNMKKFMDNNKDADDAEFVVINSRGGKPELVPSISDSALNLKADDVYKDALKAIDEGAAPTEAIKAGATIGKRIWGQPGAEADPSVATAAVVRAKAVLSDLQKEYREYFRQKLEEFDVKSPADLSEEKRKEFFTAVDKGWTNGKGVSGFALLAEVNAAEELAEAILGNYTANTSDDDAHKEFFAKKWEQEQEMLEHQLVESDGKLSVPGGSEPAGSSEDAVEASISARIDTVAERMSTLRVSTLTRLAVEEAADILSQN